MDAELKPIFDRLLTLEEGQNALLARMTALMERQTDVLDQHSQALAVILERLRRN